MKRILYLVTFLAVYQSTAQQRMTDWVWAAGASVSKAGGTFAERITRDDEGNTYLTCGYRDTIIIGDQKLVTEESYSGILAKYNANGELVWAKNLATKGGAVVAAIAVDISGIYVAGTSGYYYGDTTIVGNDTLLGYGNDDIFIAKYDKNGNALWARNAGGEWPDEIVSGIAIDAEGNVVLNGYSNSDTSHFWGQDYYYSDGGIYTIKIDREGKIIWVRQGGGLNSARGAGVATDARRNVYASGFIRTPGKFGGYTLPDSGNNFFVIKYDAEGSIKWVRTAKSEGCFGFSVATDKLGSVYVYGGLSDTVVFGNYLLRPTRANTDDLFIAKYDGEGNLQWAKNTIQTKSFKYPEGFYIDDSGCIYVSHSLIDTTTIADTTIVKNSRDLIYKPTQFLAKLNRNGHCVWVKEIYATNTEAICVDPDENVYFTGGFRKSVVFGAAQIIDSTSETGEGMFLAKLAGNTNMPKLVPAVEGFVVYPNPAKGSFTVQLPENEQMHALAVYNVYGQVTYSMAIEAGKKKISVDIANQTAGVYYLKLAGSNRTLSSTLLLQH
jgi:hypothetical protein